MTKQTIFTDSPIGEAAARSLREGAAAHELIFPEKPVTSVLGKPEPDPAFGRADIAFGQPDIASIRGSDRLKWLHISTSGYTRYDTPEFRELAAARGLIVTNSARVYAAACADHALAFLLAQSRCLPEALASHAASGSEEWFRLRENSHGIRGQKLVILGFGAIGAELVRLLAPFEMQITAMRRSPHGDEPIPTVTPDKLDAPLAAADHVLNILPDNPASVDFIDATRIARMKPGVIIYNIGRGTSVDQDALLAALRSRHVSAAWLDVTDPEPLPADHPLRAEPNCHITPHTAGGHGDEAGSLVRHFLANLRRYEAGQPLRDRIM